MKGESVLGGAIGWRVIGKEKGRGMFALRDIPAGSIIEVSPAITVAATSVVENGEAPDGYLLQWDADTEGEEFCMPLGYIMLYNHSDNPNVRLENDMEEYTITAFAARDIKEGEELTWNYNCEIWFDTV